MKPNEAAYMHLLFEWGKNLFGILLLTLQLLIYNFCLTVKCRETELNDYIILLICFKKQQM